MKSLRIHYLGFNQSNEARNNYFSKLDAAQTPSYLKIHSALYAIHFYISRKTQKQVKFAAAS